jgi:site-specific recombinase XerD
VQEIPRIDELADRYLKDRIDLSKATIRSYGNVLRDFCRYSDGIPPGAITTRLFRRYFASIQERDYKRATILIYYNACLGFFDWMISEGFIEVNPARQVKPPRQEKRLPRYLTDSQISALISVYSASFTGQRMRIITLTLLGTGIRIAELCDLTMADMDLENGVIRVMGKGGKQRAVPACETLRGELRTWLEVRRRFIEPRGFESPYLFVSSRGNQAHRVCIHRHMVRMSQKAGIEPAISPHLLRHTFATRFAAGAGKDHPGNVWQLREILGHESITTTQLYVATSARMLQEGFGDPLEALV